MSGSSRSGVVETARSLLFVPGSRPDRFAGAAASGCDVTILDLEDAVPPADKSAALDSVLDWVVGHGSCIVRVNAFGTPWIANELRSLRDTGVPVMLPKTESVDQVRRAADELNGSPVIGLLETPRGVAAAEELAESGGVVRLALGNVDLATSLGIDPASHAALAYVRGKLVLASALAGLPAPIDGVSTQLDDQPALQRDVAHARELGFSAKLCIHPRQVDTVNVLMAPSAAEVEWAHKVLARAGDGVAVVDGAMVDAPVVARAQQVVSRAARP